MCGISAIYRFTSINDSDKEKLALMNREMHYRGPDEEGIWTDEICGLAHTRLSIIGLENGKQPLFNEDKSLVLVCSGKIYNYIELKKELEAKGHIFNSDSDSETILHLYEEYGNKCLEHLRGMFSLCLYDTHTNRLFAARDRIGEKTLYYAQLTTGVIFCTELKSILKYHLTNPQLNFEAFAEPIRYNYPIKTQDTYIEQIKKLEPGHYALIDKTGLSIQPYWKRSFETSFQGSFEDAKKECLRILRDSIRICLRSDVPIAILLSSGIDSSTIAALAKESAREVHVITAGYKGQHDCDERMIAKKFAIEKGLIFHEIELDELDFGRNFEELIHYIDEPICDIASMTQWALYKKAKSLGFTVLLTGTGGDELFYGYPYENSQAEALKLSHIHQSFFPLKRGELNRPFLNFMFKNCKDILSAKYRKAYNSKFVQNWTYNDYKKFAASAKLNFNNLQYSFKDLNLSFTLDGENSAEIDLIYQKKYKTFLTNLSLYLADRLGMGNAVEIRSPFIDFRLIEFVSSIPLNIRYKENVPKYFLKEIVKGIVPDYILSASKQGFTPPFSFIHEIEKNYKYQVISHNFGFFNSMLADRLLTLNLYNNV
jgi:asparagine synthase (glutamine-hydrolysing)